LCFVRFLMISDALYIFLCSLTMCLYSLVNYPHICSFCVFVYHCKISSPTPFYQFGHIFFSTTVCVIILTYHLRKVFNFIEISIRSAKPLI
jgi:hypothetical protein